MCVLLGTAGQAARQFDEERMTVQRFYRIHRFLETHGWLPAAGE